MDFHTLNKEKMIKLTFDSFVLIFYNTFLKIINSYS